MSKAVICGYYGKGNAGDEALLLSLLQMLPEGIQPIVLSANPSETSQRYSVVSCHRNSMVDILKIFKESDYFIWGGGSLMQDVTSIRSPLYYAGLMALAQQFGLKTIAWAQGIGPLNSSISRFATRYVLQKCLAVSVRDDNSASLLASWGIPCMVAPDPVWALNPKSITQVSGLPSPRVAVNLRSHPLLTSNRLNNIIQGLRNFQEATNCFILLLPFQPNGDLAIAQEISTQLSSNHKILSLDDPRELKAVFSEVDMLIGMRFHSLILAAAQKCPCFALSYDPKVTYLMDYLGLSGWELADIPEDIEAISKTWVDFFANRQGLSSENIDSLISKCLSHQQLLSNNLLPNI